MNNPDRLTRLEESITHLQRHISEQDKVMLGLAEEVARARRELALLRAQRTTPAPGDDAPADEPPPHY